LAAKAKSASIGNPWRLIIKQQVEVGVGEVLAVFQLNEGEQAFVHVAAVGALLEMKPHARQQLDSVMSVELQVHELREGFK
jgi:hypothetical protein